MLRNLHIANDFHDRYSMEPTAPRITPTPMTAVSSDLATETRLGRLARGWSGWVVGFAPTEDLSISWHELERRLLEMGLVEGARIEVLHEGPIGGDPIAVRVDDITVALRRREADVVLVSDAE